MATKKGIQVKFNPVATFLPPPLQCNDPGANTSNRGNFPDTDSGTGGSIAVQCTIISGFLFVSSMTEVDGVDLIPFGRYAVFQISTGKLDTTTFAPKFESPSGAVARVFVFDGRHIYIGGRFNKVDGLTQINGKNIGGLARFDMEAGGALDDTWNPEPDEPFGVPDISSMELNPDKKTLMIAGNIDDIGGLTRNRIGEVSTVDDSVTAWDPNCVGGVEDIAYDAATKLVYLAGGWSVIFGASLSPGLIRATTAGAGAQDLTWQPDPTGPIPLIVRTIFLDGARTFVGGHFDTIGNTPVTRNQAAEIDNVGEATVWDPNVTLTGSGDEVFWLEKIQDTTLARNGKFKEYILIAGRYDDVGGTARKSISAVNIDDSTDVASWDPNPGGAAPQILGTAVKGRTVYLSGTYTVIGPSPNVAISGIPFPFIDDTNAKFFSKAGDDTAAGTRADPLLTISKTVSVLAGAFDYGVCLDSGIYEERLQGADAIPVDRTLMSEFGNAPTIQLRIGAADGTFGARVLGRTKFSTGAFPSTFVFVSKAGNDGTGTRGDQSLPFLTIPAAIAAGLDADTLQIEDDGTYVGKFVVSGFTTFTIQAAAGRTPMLFYNDPFPGGGIHLDSQGAGQTLDIYGLSFQTAPDKEVPDVRTILAAGPLNVFDCTFNKGAEIVKALKDVVVTNCLFSENTRRSIEVTLKGTITNSYFLNCGGTDSAPTTATVQSPTTGSDLSMDHCTFENPGFYRGELWNTILIQRAVASPAGTDLIEFCDFFNNTNKTLPTRGVQVQRVSSSPAAVTTRIEDCRFEDLGRQALFFNTAFNGGWLIRARRCLATRCASQATADEGTYHFIKPNLFLIEDLVTIASGLHGFWVDKSDLTPTGTTFFNCTAMSSGGDGFREDFNGFSSNTTRYQACIEGGSVGNGFNHVDPVITFTNEIVYCNFERPLVSGVATPRLHGTIQDSDPKFISTVPNGENTSLFADSPAIFSGSPNLSENMGSLMPIIRMDNAGSSIEGFIIKGPRNFYNGINVDFRLVRAGGISFCTFQDLGTYAVRIGSAFDVRNCRFENKGIGIQVGESDSIIERSVGFACSSAFLVAAGNHLMVRNNTTYLCDFGQFDRLGASFDELKNNVYSGNSQLDYSGDAVMSNSVVVNLGGSATVVNGSRLNPLFRDTETPDLRLQTKDSGFFFDSPAFGLGDDGNDAGAFLILHGVAGKKFTLVDFEKVVSATKIYRNPTFYTRKSTALKIREGETHGGITYSEASSFKREHVLTWQDNTDMPPEQVVDLEAIFTTGEGECQISFDGGVTFQPVRVIRSGGFQFSEIADATYSDDSLPTPVPELVFRESS